MNEIFKRDEDGEMIYFTYLPDLKKPVLAIGNKNVIHKVASFDNEECAEQFCRLLKRWFNIKEE